jgi:transposase InsO family protein
MPWQARDTMSLRREFVELAVQEGVNRRELCRRFGVSPKTAYKWLTRFRQDGAAGLYEHSRRPHQTPGRTVSDIEAAVVALRMQHSAWGGRKIARRLRDLDGTQVAPSTVTSILHRYGLITGVASAAAEPWQRFEHAEPNQLWQIDFKGYFDTPAARCHPLTMLDDHSRFNLVLKACSRTDHRTVQPWLIETFRRYGLPVRINADNGAPWGAPSAPAHGLSRLSVWLIRLGIRVSHSRPWHPQTNGKEERFHRTLQTEVLNGRGFEDLGVVQQAFDRWRTIYNCERPHEALSLNTPASRYRPSPRSYPEQLPPIEYGPDDTVCQVPWNGWLNIHGRRIKVSNALTGLPIAVRPRTDHDGRFDFYFCHQRFMQVDLQDWEDRE